MKLNGRQKLCVGVLGVAAAALVVDRVFLAPDTAGPAPASAADRPDAAPAAGQVQPLIDDGTAAPGVSVAQQLQTAWQQCQVDLASLRDAFSPPRQWVAQAAPDRPVEPARIAAERFVKQHRLKSVMAAGRGGSAIVDDKLLAVGQKLDGFTLVTVAAEAVVLEGDGVRVTLRLKDTAGD